MKKLTHKRVWLQLIYVNNNEDLGGVRFENLMDDIDYKAQTFRDLNFNA